MDTIPTRQSINTVLMLDQPLRLRSQIKPTLGECTVFAGKALLSIHA